MYSTLLWTLVVGLTPPADPAGTDQRDLSERLYYERHDLEATERYEALLAAGSRDPAVVGLAGELRLGLRHYAHAWRHLQAFLAAEGVTAAERRQKRRWSEEAAAETSLVELRVEPAAVATQLVAVRVGADPPPPPLPTAILAGVAAVRLDLGAWEIQIDAPGYAPLRQIIEVNDTTAPFFLKLEPVAPPVVRAPVRPAPAPAPPPAPVVDRRARSERIAGAVILPLGIAALAGMVALVPGHQQTGAGIASLREDLRTCACTDEDRVVLADFIATARRQEIGLATLGSAGGALIVTGVALLTDARRRQRRTRVSLDAAPGRVGAALLFKF